MEKKTSKKVRFWTPEEEEILLKATQDFDLLRDAFEAASHMLDRTPRACSEHWTSRMRKHMHLREETVRHRVSREKKYNVSLMCVSANNIQGKQLYQLGYKEKSLLDKIKYWWKSITNLFVL